ncbi:Centrosomal protein [Merluccius polli]|uniref:Centrosomal protein n=1 Tax=Merluccius polli TaxID=89951 RepID=A0AA47MIJ3_MERPO|nr:Centrosomal protein [Merluccius polli]
MLLSSNLCCCVQESQSDHGEMEVDQLRQENASLKRTLDQFTHQDAVSSDRLLQRILSLETVKEKNFQQLMAKDKEIATLRYKLHMIQEEEEQEEEEEEEIFVSLQEQLDTYIQEKEPNDNLIQSLQTETVEVKDKLVTMSARCQYLEERVEGEQALEKNQQWLAYDQQREHYVKGLVDRLSCLEQQLNHANQALSQQHNEAHSGDKERMSQMPAHYETLLLKVRTELEAPREQLDVAHDDLDKMQWSCAKKQEAETEELEEQLQEELRRLKSVQEEKTRLRAEVEDFQHRLDEEKHRSAELLLQVNLLQRSVLNHQDDQRKIEILEHQIQTSSKHLEEEKRNGLNFQRQLYRVLRELRRTSKTAESERPHQDTSGRQTSRSTVSKSPKVCGSSPHTSSALNESILECPGCRAQYPSSQHRELLAHLDHCLD